MTKDASWAGNRRGLATLTLPEPALRQCQVQLSSPLPAPETPAEGPNSTSPQTGGLLWSTKWPCCAMDVKGLEKVTKLEQLTTPYILKFFWSFFFGKETEKLGDSRRGNTFLQISLPFSTYVNFFDMSAVSTSGPVADNILIMHTQSQFCNDVFLPHLRSVLALMHSFLRFMNLLLQNRISQYTSPICSWLESTFVLPFKYKN